MIRAIICVILVIVILYKFIKDNKYNIHRLLVKIVYDYGKISYYEYVVNIGEISKLERYEKETA